MLAHVRAWSDGLAERLRTFPAAGGEVVLRKSLLDRTSLATATSLRPLDDQVLALE